MLRSIELPQHLADMLLAEATAQGQSLEAFLSSMVEFDSRTRTLTSTRDTLSWEDQAMIAEAEAASPVSLDAIRSALSRIPVSLADDIIESRSERF